MQQYGYPKMAVKYCQNFLLSNLTNIGLRSIFAVVQQSGCRVVQSSKMTKSHKDDQNNMKTHPLDKLSLTLPEKKKSFPKFSYESCHSDHLTSIWNFQKTLKLIQYPYCPREPLVNAPKMHNIYNVYTVSRGNNCSNLQHNYTSNRMTK